MDVNDNESLLPVNPYAEQEKEKNEQQKQRVIDMVKRTISEQKSYCVLEEKLEPCARNMLYRFHKLKKCRIIYKDLDCFVFVS